MKKLLSICLALLIIFSVITPFTVPSAEELDPVTVEFYYNYTGAPAARPASFTKITGADGKLASFPVEQTLPQYGSRADYGFIGWYTTASGAGEKVTLETVFEADTSLYARWEQVPSMCGEYADYFLMGGFVDFSSTNAQMIKHYNINCPSNNFKLTNQIGSSGTASASRTAYTARIAQINAMTISDEEKAALRQLANEDVRLQAATPAVVTMLNNIRNYNNNNPNNKKYTRFHTIMWHGGQQPKYFFTNGFTYSTDATSNNLSNTNPTADGAWASRETMKARIDNYVKALVEYYLPYKDILVSWDIINEPVDDFTGQIRNMTDSASQRGDWGKIWHDQDPARNANGTLKYTTAPNAMNVILDNNRLYDESEYIRWAYESAAKWFKHYDCNWSLWLNDYMDSNKPYTKLQPTLDVLKWVGEDIDTKGLPITYGFQGRLAWAYPTIDMLRQQAIDALDVADLIGVSEADVRTDFEPNPFWNPNLPTVPVQASHTPQWNYNNLNSGSGSSSNPAPATLTNTFDAHNGPARRMPEWNTGNGMINVTVNRTNGNFKIISNGELFAISEQNMKNQADFAADWMDILVENASRVEVYQWDGTSDSGTFNSSKGAHLWVTGVTGRTGTFEKYSFFAVIGAPARDKLKTAMNAFPAVYWEANADTLAKAQALLEKRIYTLEGVNDVKAMTASLTASLAALDKAYISYDAHGGAGAVVTEAYDKGDAVTAKAPEAVGISKDGYALTGWNTSANGIGKTYAPGEAIDTSVSVKLYAQWRKAPSTYKVKFESYNHGYSGSTLVNPIIPDQNVAVGGRATKPATPVKAGYAFAGWYRDMALTNAWDFSGAVTEDMRLFAKWIEPSPVAIQFNYNYTNSPARPASFNKTTGADGKLISFPVEQTLPQYGSRADYGFIGWYTTASGDGEKVTLETVFAEDTSLYARWEQVPSLCGEYAGYFLMGSFSDFNANSAQMIKHYNINCPSNSFKLDSQIGSSNTASASRTAYNTRVAQINAMAISDAEKAALRQEANVDVRLQATRSVVTMLNNLRNYNNNNPNNPKYTRFHTIMWHGGQQPKYFFTNGFTYTNDATSNNLSNTNPNADGAWASRETMKARVDNYIKALVEAYLPYKDYIVSWDIINEPIDDFTGQVRNITDSPSQRGDWGKIWHDQFPARNANGTLKYTTAPNAMNVILDDNRLYDESEYIRWAYEAAAKWFKHYDCDWSLWLNDYMDSNKPYTKLKPTLDVLKWVGEDIDTKGLPITYGFQGRLAWGYPTIDMLRQQAKDALDIADLIGVSEADVRSDFEPNPFWNPNLPTVPVQASHTPQWNYNNLSSGSGSSSNPTPGTLINTFDAHNGPARRMPEWNTGNGMINVTVNRTNGDFKIISNGELFAISEQIMKNQADFAADWMDILVENASRVEVYQWDGTTDSATFNSSKGAHMWVSNVTGRTGTFEKYSFFAVIGSPARDKLRTAMNAFPAVYWEANADTLAKAQALLEKRIYTLEGVNDVKALTASLTASLAALDKAYISYDAHGGAGAVVTEVYDKGAAAIAKAPGAVGISKAGYALAGWNTSANGIGKTYAPGEALDTGVSVRLYAQWEKAPETYAVKFESYNHGYTGSTLINPVFTDQQVAVGGNAAEPLDPVKRGYGFYGWYRNMALTDQWDFDAPVTEDMRLFAKWGAPINGVYFSYTGVISAVDMVPGETLLVDAYTDVGDSASQVMLVALYSPDGKLVKVNTVNGTAAGGKFSFSADFGIPSGTPGGSVIKVFIWDAATFVPIQEAVTFPAQ